MKRLLVVSFRYEDDDDYDKLIDTLTGLGGYDIEVNEVEEEPEPHKGGGPKPVKNFGPRTKMRNYGDSFPEEK